MTILTRKDPWYAGGLAFESAGCGASCAGPGEGYVWVTPPQISEISEHLHIPEGEVRRKYIRKVRGRFSLTEREGNKDCVFLTFADNGTRKCLIYPVRPAQCRTWPFWESNLKRPDSWTLASLTCKGINRGPLHTRDEIDAKRKATRP